mmetsp:Transcript_9284/g.14267  ORF Transcript_9284/g.14267 Transcript_9284/m.14267 type:complete len:82 (+) Transcript_9284:437-682(+)
MFLGGTKAHGWRTQDQLVHHKVLGDGKVLLILSDKKMKKRCWPRNPTIVDDGATFSRWAKLNSSDMQAPIGNLSANLQSFL